MKSSPFPWIPGSRLLGQALRCSEAQRSAGRHMNFTPTRSLLAAPLPINQIQSISSTKIHMGVNPKIGGNLKPPKSSHLFIGFGTMIYKPSILGGLIPPIFASTSILGACVLSVWSLKVGSLTLGPFQSKAARPVPTHCRCCVLQYLQSCKALR